MSNHKKGEISKIYPLLKFRRYQKGVVVVPIVIILMIIFVSLALSTAKNSLSLEKITSSHVISRSAQNDVEEILTHTQNGLYSKSLGDVMTLAVQQNVNGFSSFHYDVNWNDCGSTYLSEKDVLFHERFLGFYRETGEPLNEISFDDDTAKISIYFLLNAKKVVSDTDFADNNIGAAGLACANNGAQLSKKVTTGSWSGHTIVSFLADDFSL